MKIKTANVEMSCTIELTEKEVRMLNYLFGFRGDHIAESIVNKITGEYTAKDWIELAQAMRAETEQTVLRMRDTRDVFRGEKNAVKISIP